MSLFNNFVVIAGSITAVCVIMLIVTGNFLPLLLLVGVTWAIFCIASGIAGDD